MTGGQLALSVFDDDGRSVFDGDGRGIGEDAT